MSSSNLYFSVLSAILLLYFPLGKGYVLTSSACSNQYAWRASQELRRKCIALSSSMGDEDTTNYDNEETLLQMHLSILPEVSKEEAIERVSRYCQSFPFAAVLPVQPLTYMPTQDGGVEVRFLRKKTKEKGSLDGGIRFFVTEDDEKEGIEIVVKRNSQGQTIPKMFSEKLVVQGFVKGIGGESPDKTSPAPTNVVALESVFHKWLEV